MKILKASQISEVDRHTTEKYRVPSLLLMENAGRAVAERVRQAHADLAELRVYVFCGKGNNGGDGLVAARHLALSGVRPEVLLLAAPEDLRGDARANWEMISALGVPAHCFPVPSAVVAYLRRSPPPDVIIDAVFGTGLSKPIRRHFKGVIHWINSWEGKCSVISVDIPSGLFSDTGAVSGEAVKAHETITMTALKPALVLPPAADFAGHVEVASIGSPLELLDNPDYAMDLIDDTLVRDALPLRARESHKGDFGHVYVVAGSQGKSGAALMTGLSALRAGAGLVTVWLPESLQREILGEVPELMTEALPETPRGTADRRGLEKVLGRSNQASVLVIGPGLSTDPSTRDLIRELVHKAPVPVVLDADGVNAFEAELAELRNDQGNPIVITPHPGEMARLLGVSMEQVQKSRVDTVLECAERGGVFAVLKGFQTLFSNPAGHLYVNNTGNPGMATGGSGDILAGMMGRFVGGWLRNCESTESTSESGLDPYVAAAIYLHGVAGDLAKGQKGVEPMIATDMIGHFPEAFESVRLR